MTKLNARSKKLRLDIIKLSKANGGYHYGDFYIGLTDKTPIVSAPDVLVEWSGVNWTQVDGTVGTGNTVTLTKKDVLYG